MCEIDAESLDAMTLAIQQAMNEIERLWTSFNRAVYEDGDVDAAMATTHDECVLTTVPIGIAADDRDSLRHYLAADVIPHLPDDLAFKRVTRTLDQHRLVEELTVSFTHDRALPWLLPGAAPTHRRAEVSAMVILGVRHQSRLGVVHSSIVSHRTMWDYVGLLAQLGLRCSDVAIDAATT